MTQSNSEANRLMEEQRLGGPDAYEESLTPDAEICKTCGHIEELHDDGGDCLAADCDCIQFTQENME